MLQKFVNNGRKSFITFALGQTLYNLLRVWQSFGVRVIAQGFPFFVEENILLVVIVKVRVGSHHANRDWPVPQWHWARPKGPGAVFTTLYFLRNLQIGPTS